MTEKLTRILQKANYFQGRVVKVHPPATATDILQSEEKLGWIFSSEMKEFLSYSSGIQLIEYCIFGVQFAGVRKIPKDFDIVIWNELIRGREWWPTNWLKLGRDGFGNYLIAVSSKEGKKEVSGCYWVDKETLGTQKVTTNYIGDFHDLINYSIDEMMKFYNSEGQLKTNSR